MLTHNKWVFLQFYKNADNVHGLCQVICLYYGLVFDHHKLEFVSMWFPN